MLESELRMVLAVFFRKAARACALRKTLVVVVSAGAAAWVAGAQQVPWATSISPATTSQTLSEDRGADGLWQTLRKLQTWGSVMDVVAHPDDEDGGMLAFESRGAGVRTSLLTLTRGEGGQNAMSGETYDALGLMRTQELLRADQFYGTEQYWGSVADYGFSKTIDEAFEHWGHDRVLYDAVRAVRLNRPLVVTATFVGAISDGHGQHQVSGELAQEVFNAAGDPNVFPDQIQQGLRPWSPWKVYARVPMFSVGPKGIFDYATNKWAPPRFMNYATKEMSETVPAANVEVPEGNHDPVLGRSYLQMAREGWGEQKSQNGGGYIPLSGTESVPYHRYASRVQSGEHEDSFFDGIDVSLVGMAALAHGDTAFLKAGLRDIAGHVTSAMAAYIPASPEKIAPELADGYLKTKELMEQVNASSLPSDDKQNIEFELNIKLAQFNNALAEALGLEATAFVAPTSRPGQVFAPGLAAEETAQTVSPGSQFDVRLHVASANGWAPGGTTQLVKTWLTAPDGETWQISRIGSPGLDDARSIAGDAIFRVGVPLNAAYTRPYYTRPNTEQPYYDIHDPRWRTLSFAPYPLTGWAEFSYRGVPVRVGQVVQTVRRIHGLGSISQPMVVAPNLSLTLDRAAGIVPLDRKDFALPVNVHSNEDGNTEGQLHLELPAGWTSDPATASFRLAKNQDTVVSFRVHPSALAAQEYTLKAVAHSGNFEYSEGYQVVGYPAITPSYLYKPATYRMRAVDVKVAPDLNVGYVMGTGDDVPQALEDLGVHAHLLSAADVANADLSRYDVIVLGIRAYAARPELPAATGRLLEYVRNGGSVVVEYNSGEYDHNYGPYTYRLGRSPEKVVDESNKVTLLEPGHPLFAWPNTITSADFDGWVEERGHSFMESWDAKFTPLTETHDAEQDPQRGGLLYARYGKGVYIYAAFAIYRQLPEGVPGAYRLLANLVSIGKNEKAHAATAPQ